ncbi:MAG: binding-protein-dependent transport system inner rane component [Glaciihabitans sp.]|jgi:peptide/nickel transport system permease protein|nr:binding-protein-dependent transport system inner rane component [Glaciihabitans sp.]MDQ1571402.1 peptide/nickel transport system permease protein [Actinomycetota bacterium]
MLKSVLTRLGWSIAIVIVSTILVFAILRVLPGDPVLARLGAATKIDPATLQHLRAAAGLDGPLYQQYLTWLFNAVRGNLGDSYFSQQPVTELLATRIPVTIELTVIAVLLSVIIAVPLALWAAARPGSLADRIVGTSTSIGIAIPAFIYGIVLILVFALTWRLFPTRGFIPFATDPLGNLWFMVLPSVTLALVAAPQLARFLRASMIDLWSVAFVRTAEGKGASRTRVVVGHILRNALVPFITRLGVTVGYTLGGVVVVEYMFGIPGLGSLAIDSAFKRDYAVLQGVVLTIVVLFTLTTFLVDLLHNAVDPRLRKDQAHG